MEISHSKKDETTKSKETILLRYPMPKYNFQGRKLDKTESEKKEECGHNVSKQTSSTGNKQFDQKETVLLDNALSTVRLTEALAGKSISSTNSDTDGGTPGKPAIKPSHSSKSSESLTSANTVFSSSMIGGVVGKPVNIVSPATSKSTSSIPNVAEVLLPLNPACSDQSKQNETRLEKEVESLKSQFEAQLQVNSELKRMLLASMGEDLEQNVERLARDKAQLSLELGDHMRKMTADYENLDKISIQADMWRTKFLASRVMIDELANAKAFYSLQYQESQNALQQLLNERHEIRTNLLEGFKCLQQIKDAFDPFNTHQSTALLSTNILDLAKRSQQLAEVIRYRLLPAGVKVHAMVDVEANWQDRLTPAEIMAHEVISKDVNPVDYKYKLAPSLLGPPSLDVARYHPHTKYDNLTYNCCAKCHGEITLI